MRIKIYSRKEMEEAVNNHTIPHNEPIISVYDIGYESVVPAEYNVLNLQFDDVTPFLIDNHLCHPYYENEFLTRNPVLFNKNMADDVYNFVSANLIAHHKVYDTNHMLLHINCFKGMSRSVAIGLSLVLNHVGWDYFDYKEFITSDYYINSVINEWVFKIMTIEICKNNFIA